MKILITGGNGYIAKSIFSHLKNEHEFVLLNRSNSNLLDKNQTIQQLKNIQPDIIIHTATEGGSRNSEDDVSIVYKNLLMFENLMHYRDSVKFIFNIASGAEFDRSKEISLAKEDDIFLQTPSDYYGFSKNLISKRVRQINQNIVNFRIFGIFDENENDTRFIKNNINRFKNGLSPEIHTDKYMDFFYMKDFITVLSFYLKSKDELPMDINLCYEKKYKLSNLIKMIYGEDVQLENLPCSFEYTGSPEKIKRSNLNLIGMEEAIRSILIK
jgi:nucleoside-diphosphate-sugar epimerase